MNKELYYEKMKEYFEQGIVREVYSSDSVCILCIGENNYLASSYVLFDGNPVGFYVGPELIKDIIDNNGFFFTYQKKIMENFEKTFSLMYDFAPERINEWKIAIQKEGLEKEVDYDLEAEIAGMNKSR